MEDLVVASEAEIAWAAGLFEGEGCLHLANSTRNRANAPRSPRAQLTMTDKDVVERFFAIVGVGKIVPASKTKLTKPHYKPQWMWRAQSRSDFETAFFLLRPWLCNRRRRKGDEILRRLRATDFVQFTCVECGATGSVRRSGNTVRKKYCSNETCGERARRRQPENRAKARARSARWRERQSALT